MRAKGNDVRSNGLWEATAVGGFGRRLPARGETEIPEGETHLL